MTATLSPGNEWPYHYRGLSLQVSPDGDVWWQLYQGTDRLHLEPAPTDIVETLLKHKRIGGRIHITEGGDALTRVEKGEEYTHIYLGDTTIELESPTSLTDQMSAEEQDALERCAASLRGPTPTRPADYTTTAEHTQAPPHYTTPDHHRTPREHTDTTPDNQDTSSPAQEADSDDDGRPDFKDDPEEWLGLDMEATEERIYDGG